MRVDIITLNGKKLAVVPYKMWKKLIERLEDLEDIIAAKKIEADTSNEENEYFPIELIEKIRREGQNRIKVYREYRKMTQEELAEKSRINLQMIQKLENGESNDILKAVKSISKTLKIDAEILI